MIALAFLLPLAFGVKGGALLTDSTIGYTRTEDRWYTLGPSVEFRLPRKFAVEFNPLYKRTGFTSTADTPGHFFSARFRDNTWEFPVLAKYYRGPFFASGGYTGRQGSVGFAIPTRACRSDDPCVSDDPVIGFPNPADHGFAAGGGARFPIIGRLKLSAEYRYSRWVTAEQYEYKGHISGSNKNQHEILIGLIF